MDRLNLPIREVASRNAIIIRYTLLGRTEVIIIICVPETENENGRSEVRRVENSVDRDLRLE